MKKILLSVLSCVAFISAEAQVRTANNATNTAVTNSPAFIDASSNTTVNGSTNVGKGLIFPRVDLSAMTSFPAVTAGIPNSFPTRFDGMIVYNTATSGTAGVGSTSGTLTAGYWYYENKSATNTGGTWKAISGAALGDNLGNHSATQLLAMNDYAVQLRGATDATNGLSYNSTVGGPRLFGASGGYLGTSNGTNALTWDSTGNLIGYGKITASIGFGYAQLVPTNSSSNSGRLDIYKSGGTRIGYVGDDINNMFYATEVGLHSFNKGIEAAGNIKASLGAGYAQLVATSTTGNSGRLDIYKSGGTRIGYVGDNTTDMFYAAETGIHSFNNELQAAGKIRASLGAGYAQLTPSNSASTSGRLDIYKAGGTRMGYVGDDSTDMFYAAETGIHSFNRELQAAGKIRASLGAGYAQLTPSNSAITSGRLDIYKSGGTRMGYVGDDINNMSYVAEVGLHSFNKGIEASGNIKASTGGGYAQLTSGNSTNSGRLDIYRSGGTRIGYVGDATGNMNYVAEVGIHVFNTTVQASRVQGPSDKRFKKDIAKIDNATEKLNQLNGYTYTWKDKKEFPGQTLGEGKDMGVIAQEVEKVFPQAVQTNKEGYKSVNYNALIPVLIEALKESNKKIQALEARMGK